MRYLLFSIMAISIMSCNQTQKTTTIEVNHVGALRLIMHQGEIQGRVSLDTLLKPDLVGLGASESLSGEIMILNGISYESKVEGHKLKVSQNTADQATLLVYAQVSAWDTLEIDGSTDLEQIVSTQSQLYNLSEPFPFLLIGAFEQVNYHVLDFNVETDDLAQHQEESFKGVLQDENAIVLGFFATQAQGVYTHHGNNFHMHVLSKNHAAMGHVDHLVLGSSSIKLLIPKS